ncbi:serine/threonine-protein phosphatase 6 regulatory ankyrin repeat subunit C-like [Oscarella lobularis]|uniref:serine/threonine-protein phosphatase 6 regulatory ankyrin repeat subunit C-like n=1 Tax=Oscarella lobularis TaxID=121494 RepID=UPI003313979B
MVQSLKLKTRTETLRFFVASQPAICICYNFCYKRDATFMQRIRKIGIGALATASVSGKVEMALKLLKIECLVNETDYFGRTSLHMAAKWNRPAVADLLINWGANVEARDKWGRTPFLHAVCNGQTADFLLSKGCNIHAFDKAIFKLFCPYMALKKLTRKNMGHWR